MLRLVALFTGSSIIAGCTTYLDSERVPQGMEPSKPGFSYYLPRQAYKISATYELQSCPNLAGKTSDEKNAQLIISQSVTVTENTYADREQHFSIPLDTLTSGLKTTTVTVGLYPNQTLQNVGVTAEDKTAQVLKNLVGTAVTIAKINSGIFTAQAAPKSLCRDDIYASLRAIRKARLSLQDSKLDDKGRALQAAIITSARENLKIVSSFNFDPSEKNLRVIFPFDKDSFMNWFVDPAQIGAGGGKLYTRTVTTGAEIVGYTANVENPNKPAEATKGVTYRTALPVKLAICAGDCSSADRKVLFETDVQLSQLGRYAVIPLKNGPFAKNNLSLTFSEGGVPSSVTYGEESRVDKATAFLSESADSIQKLKGQKAAVKDAESAAEAAAPLNSIKADTEILKARAENVEAQQKLNELMVP
ncbi:hypothetical protein PHLH6_25360 [Pseudomonas sp. Seg1]|uniref:hypothetical protein n=1 Tax=Pseudomonas sp. Seg1 TaxID=2678259 RepID=UPI001BB37F80|nr:hypothetical protein [Pseudomonas sp. Seg1]BBP70532.1 hypothetical protein PHLH6_25360 [Pseudomonas sp. Seg1]